MTIDYNKHQVLVRGENVHLTLSEFRIVALLGKFAGKVLTYDYIIKGFGDREPAVTTRFCASIWQISAARSRKSCRTEYLFTEVGVGYRNGRELRIIENGEWKMENVAILHEFRPRCDVVPATRDD